MSKRSVDLRLVGDRAAPGVGQVRAGEIVSSRLHGVLGWAAPSATCSSGTRSCTPQTPHLGGHGDQQCVPLATWATLSPHPRVHGQEYFPGRRRPAGVVLSSEGPMSASWGSPGRPSRTPGPRP